MAMANPSDSKQFAERLQFLIDNAMLSSLDALSDGLARPKGYAWWLLHPEAANGPKRVNPQTAADCAAFLGDRGRLVGDGELLFRFLMGLEDDFNKVLKRWLQPVPVSNDEEVAPTGYGAVRRLWQDGVPRAA